MDIEAVVLTGGASKRMGEDKASLLVEGERSASRIVRLLRDVGIRSTVLGPGGVLDPTPGSGPLAALAAHTIVEDWVFVVSCDIPRFDARVVPHLRSLADASDGVVPQVEGRAQPLCALYRAESFDRARTMVELGIHRVTAWQEALDVVFVSAESLSALGLDPKCVLGANSPEEWRALIQGT